MTRLSSLTFTTLLTIALIGCIDQNDETNRKNAENHFNQAFAYLGSFKATSDEKIKNELLKNAEVELKNALSIKPDFFKARMNLGVLYVTQGKLNLAEREYDKALEIDSNNANLLYNLAALNSLMGKEDVGLDYLTKSLKNGFKDIQLLKTDTDIQNLRSSKEFGTLLETHGIFIN